MFKKAVFILALTTASHAVIANDEGLYPDAPPADAIFVRVVNITDAPLTGATLSGKSLPSLEKHTVSDYAVLSEGDINIKIGEISHAYQASAGNYYTAAYYNNDIVTLTDKKPENPSKAVINFYNLSDVTSVSLRSSTHNADIFKNVEMGKNDARDINAVSIGLAVKEGDKNLADINDVKLERQISTSLFFIGSNGAYDVIVKNNEAYK